MADAKTIAAPRPYDPPMASPGYGKKSAPDQAPRRADTFAHLPEREAYIASHIDRLPEGAAMDVKTLAKELPAYGQQAIRTALNALSAAGHLRREREPVDENRTQWVFRSYFSRTPRSDAWWTRFLRGDVPQAEAGTPERTPTHPHRSEAYETLAALGRSDARMTLSATECADLEPLAAEWLARGVPREHLVRTLTADLPAQVHSPGAFARRRLTAKIPPEPPPQPVAPARRRMMECTNCGTPGRPEALSGGLCRPCHSEHTSHMSHTSGSSQPPPVDVHALAAAAKAASRAGRDEFLTRRRPGPPPR
ncbi:hypothetical protein AB0F13_19310 [Streptomyces sp. NPDC026206]|uniref:hypothetical protein n=1 Tax=Streptomyces sp. NPDC026206 TaxID=3157089 RepID=UPI0034027538